MSGRGAVEAGSAVQSNAGRACRMQETRRQPPARRAGSSGACCGIPDNIEPKWGVRAATSRTRGARRCGSILACAQQLTFLKRGVLESGVLTRSTMEGREAQPRRRCAAVRTRRRPCARHRSRDDSRQSCWRKVPSFQAQSRHWLSPGHLPCSHGRQPSCGLRWRSACAIA